MSERHPWPMVAVIALGAAWTTALATHPGGAALWPIAAWLWLTATLCAVRALRRSPAEDDPAQRDGGRLSSIISRPYGPGRGS